MSYEIVTKESELPKMQEQASVPMVKQKEPTGLEELQKAFIEVGIDDRFLAKHTKDIIMNATTMNSEWEIHPDYETRRKAINMVIGSKDKRPKTQVNVLNVIGQSKL